MSDLLDLLDDMTVERFECGHRKGRGLDHSLGVDARDEEEHAEQCMNLTCRGCGLTEPSAYLLLMNHSINHYGLCQTQWWAFDRQGYCLTCRWPTFGQWPCRNERCAEHVCTDACKPRPGRFDWHTWQGAA